MSRSKCMTRMIGLVLLAAAATEGAALAQDNAQEGEPWALLLAAQLRDEKRCDVQVTYYVRQMPTPEGTLYSGRVRCIDGREFDFSQPKAHLKYDLRACEPATC